MHTHPGQTRRACPSMQHMQHIPHNPHARPAPLAGAAGGLGGKGSVAEHVQRASHRHTGVVAHLRQRNQPQAAASQLGFGGPSPGLAAVCGGRPRQHQEGLQAGRQAGGAGGTAVSVGRRAIQAVFSKCTQQQHKIRWRQRQQQPSRRQRTVSLSGDTDRPMPRNSTGAGRPPGSTAADCTAAPDSTAAWSSAPSLAS